MKAVPLPIQRCVGINRDGTQCKKTRQKLWYFGDTWNCGSHRRTKNRK